MYAVDAMGASLARHAAFAAVPGVRADGAPLLAAGGRSLAATSLALGRCSPGGGTVHLCGPGRAADLPSSWQPAGRCPDKASKWGRQPDVRRTRSARADGGSSVVLRSSNQVETADGEEDQPLQTVVMKKEEEGVVLAPDFRLALSVLAVGLQLWWTLNWSTLGIIISVVGGFLTMQTARLRFRFTSSAIDVLRVQGLSDAGSRSEEPGALASDAGGADGTTTEAARAVGPWKFSSIANWDFWWPGFPVLAYFKETQVRPNTVTRPARAPF